MALLPDLTGNHDHDNDNSNSQEVDNIQPFEKTGARATNGSGISTTSKSLEAGSKEAHELKPADRRAPQIRGWPSGPMTLERRGWMETLAKLYEYFLALSPVWFIGTMNSTYAIYDYTYGGNS